MESCTSASLVLFFFEALQGRCGGVLMSKIASVYLIVGNLACIYCTYDAMPPLVSLRARRPRRTRRCELLTELSCTVNPTGFWLNAVSGRCWFHSQLQFQCRGNVSLAFVLPWWSTSRHRCNQGSKTVWQSLLHECMGLDVIALNWWQSICGWPLRRTLDMEARSLSVWCFAQVATLIHQLWEQWCRNVFGIKVCVV